MPPIRILSGERPFVYITVITLLYTVPYTYFSGNIMNTFS